MKPENKTKHDVPQSISTTMLGMKFKIDCLFGHKELKQFNKFENGRMVCYGYSISYDMDGKEASRTEPSALSSIGWDNGMPFTKMDYKILMSA